MTALDQRAARARFPGLRGADVLLDNAGGSQVPMPVADRVRDYLLHSYVQLGADYATSREADATIDRARAFARMLVNGQGRGEVVFGSSTSALCAMLADCVAQAHDGRRNEIIVCQGGHEANIGPWIRLSDRGFKVRRWPVNPETGEMPMDDLDRFLSRRTRMVALYHVSNLLGRIEDVRGIVARAHAVGATVCVDGVAYAPHRAIDVAALGADFYVFSTYKTYGLHMAALFGTHAAFGELVGPNHFFVPEREVPYRFELGGPNHEGCAALVGVADYLAEVAGAPSGEALDRAGVERAFDRFTQWEQAPMDRFVEWLNSRDDVRWIGPQTADPAERVPTLSFVHRARSSRAIVEAINARGFGIRYGHFYAHRLAEVLGLDPDDGVVRTSLVHYNTVEEIDSLVEELAIELDRR